MNDDRKLGRSWSKSAPGDANVGDISFRESIRKDLDRKRLHAMILRGATVGLSTAGRCEVLCSVACTHTYFVEVSGKPVIQPWTAEQDVENEVSYYLLAEGRFCVN